MPSSDPAASAPLAGVRVLSLALNLPGPAALMRCQRMGAACVKLEPPAPEGLASADPMGTYNPLAYAMLHEGVTVLQADLKNEAGQALLHEQLAQTDVLLTSFRPSALAKLGLGWETLHARHPRLSLVAIVGAPGERAEEPGHDLTYLAEAGLLVGDTMPPTLFADMGGAMMASEAVLQAQLRRQASAGEGVRIEVALNAAAEWLALPRSWGLTMPDGAVGGAHAGYRIYSCADGRVVVAALEPHFAAALRQMTGVLNDDMYAPAVHEEIALWFATATRAQLDAIAGEFDIPLYTLPS
jgi:crotonobetainyl-CoA:carnitine CoA-transferase CaiB-like acyl-CoA transferase